MINFADENIILLRPDPSLCLPVQHRQETPYAVSVEELQFEF